MSAGCWPPPCRPRDRHPSDQPLIEPLSERELEVLRLLESDLDGPEIARELVVSLDTVRTHTRNIYAKLGVNNRREPPSAGPRSSACSRAAGTADPPRSPPSSRLPHVAAASVE